MGKHLAARDYHVILVGLTSLQAGNYPAEIGLTMWEAKQFNQDVEEAIVKIRARLRPASFPRWEHSEI